jgi:hypothetical protein
MAGHKGRHVYGATIRHLIGNVVNIGTWEPRAVSTELLRRVEISCMCNTCDKEQAIGQSGSRKETHDD